MRCRSHGARPVADLKVRHCTFALMFDVRQKIGILGGGQLGKMLCQAAADWHLPVLVLDPTPDAPAASLCREFTVGDFRDYDTVWAFGQKADLLTVENGRVLSSGTPLYLTGRVLTARGVPIAGALVEIWQCDANAVYHHPAGGAVGQRDPHFQGYGTATTDAAGAFHFRTIEPVPYPGRTPHIHVRVSASGVPPLPTQLYLDGHPENARDFLYRQLDQTERAAVTLKLRPTQSTHPLAQATRLSAAVDLIVG